jgi:hypothetical protein
MPLTGIADTEDRERFRVEIHSHYAPPGYLEALRTADGKDDRSVFRASRRVTSKIQLPAAAKEHACQQQP